jgi:hypothetical protein
MALATWDMTLVFDLRAGLFQAAQTRTGPSLEVWSAGAASVPERLRTSPAVM